MSDPRDEAIEYEQAVLASIITGKGVLQHVISILTPEMFTKSSHRNAYEALCDVAASPDFEIKDLADSLMVKAALRKHGYFKTVNNGDLWYELSRGCPSFENAKYYAKLVRKAWERRELAKATLALSQAISTGDEDVIREAKAAVSEFRHAVDTTGEVENMELVDTIINKAMDGSSASEAISTGIGGIDVHTHGGLRRGELWALGGRPSSGKSTLVLNMFAHGLRHGRTMAVFSLELTREQFIGDLISHMAGVDAMLWRTNTGQKEEASDDWKKVVKAKEELMDSVFNDCLINDSTSLTPALLRAECLEHIRKVGKLDVVFLDHLQLLNTDRKSKDVREYDRVSDASRACKLLAKEASAVVVALSQLSRLAANVKPELHHLRASGTIEQDADGVIMINETPNGEDRDSERVDLHIEKNRHGGRGQVEMIFRRNQLTFVPNPYAMGQKG
jgi:replicative DNA helicase